MISAGITDIVDPPLDAFPVKVKDKQEDDSDEGKNNPQKDIGGLQNTLQISSIGACELGMFQV